MIHPHTQLQFINSEKGFGVVATEFIPKGTITWIGDSLDHELTPAQILTFDEKIRETLNKYCYINHKGNYILCWDISRYVNHSFTSNCISTAYNFELAVRDIHPGEELTDDYGYLNPQEPIFFPKEEGSDRTHVLPDDLLNYNTKWDLLLNEAFRTFNAVKQPLSHLIEETYREKVKMIAAGEKKMDSILNCYYNPLPQPR